MTTWDKLCEHNLLANCWQTCYTRCEIFACAWHYGHARYMQLAAEFKSSDYIMMHLTEKYKENFDVSSEGPYRREIIVTNFPTKYLRSKRRRSPCIQFRYSCIPIKINPPRLSYYSHYSYLHWYRRFKKHLNLPISMTSAS